MDLLFETLDAITPLSPSLRSYLAEHIDRVPFSSHTYTPYHNFRNSILYFVSSGYLGGVRLNTNGEVPLIFFSKGDFIIPSLVKQKPDFINTLTFYSPSLLLGISLEDAKNALHLFPETLDLFLWIIDQHINKGNRRELLLRMSAQERFSYLQKTHPRLFMHCTSRQLAGYLNISTRQLMRFKTMK